MQRRTVDLSSFRRNFIDGHVGGLFPVHAEVHDLALDIDIVCGWRVADGNLLLVRVPFSSSDEFDTLTEYVRHGADELRDAVLQNADRLQFPG